MRIVVMGGAGQVGAELSADLAALDELNDLVIADVGQPALDGVLDRIGHERASAVAVDLYSEDARALVEGADLVVNCTSFTHFDRVLDLAVAAKANYADLFSEPTAAHREKAAQAGITAISGLGLTPGLSNVLVAKAVGELGPPRDVEICWVADRPLASSRGLLDTITYENSEACRTRMYLRDGRLIQARPFEGTRIVDYPLPMGRRQVHVVPHPEAETLPRNFPSLRNCAVRGGWREDLLADIRVLNKYGLLDDGRIDVGGDKVTPYEATVAQMWQRAKDIPDLAPTLLYLYVEVGAIVDGAYAERRYTVTHPADWGKHGVGRTTGICAAVGVQLLARHGVAAKPGFADPEVYYDPDEFLGELASRKVIDVQVVDERAAVAST